MIFVLDATAVRSGMPLSGEFRCLIPPSVKEEISRGKQAKDLETQLGISVEIRQPGEDFLIRVKEAAAKTGDIGRLSETDLDVLALGLETGATILTDDYSVQNVAKVMGIAYRGGAREGIKEVYTWRWRCRGCGRYFDEEHEDCPVCGSGLRTVRKQ